MSVLQGKIRGFLLQHPKPSKVRLTGDGEPQEIRPGKSYIKCAQTIDALGGTLLECLDADGETTRAMRLDEDPQKLSSAAPIPEGLQKDPSALMLMHLANIVSRAYEHSTEIAFIKLVELVEKMNDRADGIEMRLERAEAMNRRMLLEQTDREVELAEERAEQAANGESGNDLGSAIVNSFLGGAMTNGGKVAPVNGAAKGKG